MNWPPLRDSKANVGLARFTLTVYVRLIELPFSKSFSIPSSLDTVVHLPLLPNVYGEERLQAWLSNGDTFFTACLIPPLSLKISLVASSNALSMYVNPLWCLILSTNLWSAGPLSLSPIRVLNR